MYVVERATLLHDAVRRYLEGRLPVSAAFGYLSAYEGVAGARWHELGRVIDEVARLPTAPDHILAAAHRTRSHPHRDAPRVRVSARVVLQRGGRVTMRDVGGVPPSVPHAATARVPRV
jgi:hypothetical protein